MFIELNGVNFKNKGSALMLNSIVRQIEVALPDAKIVMPPRDFDLIDYGKRARLGLYTSLRINRSLVPVDYLSKFIPRRIRNTFGIIPLNNINVVLDASGFAYSDQWGSSPAINMLRAMKRWKRQGTKIVFLPQAFGPFEKTDLKKAFIEMMNLADLVFPRDDVSYKHVINLVGEKVKIKKNPDFTNILEVVSSDKFTKYNKMICVIPNCRMIDKTEPKIKDNYIFFIVDLIDRLIQSGEKVFLLNHEGRDDRLLCERIRRDIKNEIEVINPDDPIEIKALIGATKAVIGSRFHGLVSALSQGVPALAIGWSHKYNMLFNDYDLGDYCIDNDSDHKHIDKFINMLSNRHDYINFRSKLLESSAIEKRKTKEMWSYVFSLINGDSKTINAVSRNTYAK